MRGIVWLVMLMAGCASMPPQRMQEIHLEVSTVAVKFVFDYATESTEELGQD
jgi:hypothetical protein